MGFFDWWKKTAQEFVKGTGDQVVGIARGIARTPETIARSAIDPFVVGDQSSGNVTDPFRRALYGAEPVQTYQKRAEGNQEVLEGSRFRGAATPLALLGAGLTIGSDITGNPFKEGGEQLVKQLIKETSESGVKNILSKRVAPEVAERLAPALARAKNADEVAKILQTPSTPQGGFFDGLAKSQAKTPISQDTAPQVGKAVSQPLAIEAPGVTPSSKLVQAITEAKPQLEEFGVAQSKERIRRGAAAGNILQGGEGESAFQQARGALQGTLAEQTGNKVIRNALSKEDVTGLFEQIKTHSFSNNPVLDTYNKVNTADALTKFLDGTKLPQPKQLEKLEEVFGPELVSTIQGLGKNWKDTAKNVVTEIANIPRAAITSLDMSNVLRQSIIPSVSHPVRAFKNIGKSLGETFSQKNFDGWLDDLYSNPEYLDMKDAGLYIADPRRISTGLSGKEEHFMSNVADKLPWVKASERNYLSYGNKTRVDLFKNWRAKLAADGQDNAQNLKKIAKAVNTLTGRGSLGKAEGLAQELNTVLFSPRLIASRVKLFTPKFYTDLPPEIRKSVVGDIGKTLGVGMTVLALAKANGAEVSADPRSADFGKIKVGNTRWDIWGGFQQYVRAMAQIALGRKDSRTGKVSRDPVGVISQFATSKLAPTPRAAIEALRGKTLFGNEPINIGLDEGVQKNVFYKNLSPLYLQDATAAVQEQGPEAILTVGAPGVFGVGTQTYQDTANPQSTTPEDLQKSVQEALMKLRK